MELPQGGYIIKMACDGLAVIDKVGIETEYIKCSSQNVDMVLIISELWSTSPFSLVAEHMYIHQDNLKRPLIMLEILNYNMNIMAKSIALD